MINVVQLYKEVLYFDNIYVEVIVCIVIYYFYIDQLEIVFRFYW